MSAPWNDPEPLDALGLPFGSTHPQASEPAVEIDPRMLAEALQALETRVEGLDGQLTAAVDVVMDEKTGIEPLNLAVEAILDLLTAQPGGPWRWEKLSVDKRRELWAQLGEWVQWLENRYLIHLSATEYPLAKCWYRHPVAVELLTALMVAHHATYASKAVVPSFMLVEWHTRALEPVFSALRTMKVFGNCDPEHVEPTRSVRHDNTVFETWVDQVDPDPLSDDDDQGALG